MSFKSVQVYFRTDIRVNPGCSADDLTKMSHTPLDLMNLLQVIRSQRILVIGCFDGKLEMITIKVICVNREVSNCIGDKLFVIPFDRRQARIMNGSVSLYKFIFRNEGIVRQNFELDFHCHIP